MKKALVIIFLVLSIFGAAAYFGYELFVKPQQMLKDEIAQGPPPAPPDPSVPEFEKCMKLKQENKPLEAQSALESFLENNPNSTKLQAARDALGEINTDIFFSAIPTPEKEQYVVKSGDALAKIERKMKTTGELIMRSNNLEDPTKLQVGQVLTISHPQFTLTINRKQRQVTLFNRGRFFKQYHVKAWNAPVTKSTAALSGKVTDKIAWRNGTRVAFGTKDYAGSARWVSISIPGYTLYTDPQEGGEQAPSGIALSSEEMEELSTLLSRGVPVTIE